MSKNVAEPEGSHMTSQYGACALQAGQARLLARTRPGTHTDKHVIRLVCQYCCLLRCDAVYSSRQLPVELTASLVSLEDKLS